MLRAHPAFNNSFLAPSASLTVPPCKHSSGPAAFVAACSCAIWVPARLMLLVPGCMLRSVNKDEVHRRVGTRCALSSSGPPHPVRWRSNCHRTRKFVRASRCAYLGLR
jgi:hypothetical protein